MRNLGEKRNYRKKRNSRKKRTCRIATALLWGMFLFGTAIPAFAGQETSSQESFSKEPGSAVIEGIIQPQNLEAAREADQMIVAVGTGGCKAQVFYYKKGETEWELAWQEDAVVGKNGITGRKAEGDKSTPAGTYGLTMSFGLKEDPGSILPYHTIVQGDYWVDDPSSPYYNQLVNICQISKNWDSAEDMASASPYYDYGLALDYNKECVPGKGSAIFLHCFTASPDSGSAGCIRLPESRMRELVQSATERTKVVIAADLSQLK